MREIIPRRLWLGNANDARAIRQIHDLGVAAIVDLAFEESVPQLTRDLIYCRFPLIDSSGNSPEVLMAAIETLNSFLRKQMPALVACGAGMSRSPAIVAASLALVRGQSPEDALEQLTAGNPHDVSPLLWSEVKDAYNELAG